MLLGLHARADCVSVNSPDSLERHCSNSICAVGECTKYVHVSLPHLCRGFPLLRLGKAFPSSKALLRGHILYEILLCKLRQNELFSLSPPDPLVSPPSKHRFTAAGLVVTV